MKRFSRQHVLKELQAASSLLFAGVRSRLGVAISLSACHVITFLNSPFVNKSIHRHKFCGTTNPRDRQLVMMNVKSVSADLRRNDQLIGVYYFEGVPQLCNNAPETFC